LESSLSSSDEAESVISSAAPFDDDDNSGREQEGDTERDGSFNDIDIEDELDEEELETLTVTMLKKRPKKRDLKFSGKKAELIDR